MSDSKIGAFVATVGDREYWIIYTHLTRLLEQSVPQNDVNICLQIVTHLHQLWLICSKFMKNYV